MREAEWTLDQTVAAWFGFNTDPAKHFIPEHTCPEQTPLHVRSAYHIVA